MTQNPPRAPRRREDSSPLGERSQGSSRSLLIALVGSVAVHLAVLIAVLPPNFSILEPDQPAEEKPFNVKTIVEEVEPDEEIVAQNRPERDTSDEVEPEEIKPKEEEKDEEKEEKKEVEKKNKPQPPTPPPELNRKVVQQENNEEQEPDDARFLADKSNRVDEETRARETTQKDVLAGKTVPEDLKEVTGADEESRADEQEPQQEQIAESAETPAREKTAATPPPPEPQPVAEATPPEQKPSEQASPEKSEDGNSPAIETAEKSPFVSKASPKKSGAEDGFKPPPRSLFQPSAKDYNEIFGEADKKAASTVNRHKKGRRLLKGWKKREAAMRASLENVNVEVRPGNHTGVNASAAVYASFISRIHRKLHPRWGGGFLFRLERDYGPGDPMSNPKMEVTLEYILDGKSGEVQAVNIAKSSGQTMFDTEAIVIFNDIGPHTGAPDEIISPDGNVYIHWTLWRNQQQCGPWGASIFIVDNGMRKRIDRGGKAGADASQSGGR